MRPFQTIAQIIIATSVVNCAPVGLPPPLPRFGYGYTPGSMEMNTLPSTQPPAGGVPSADAVTSAGGVPSAGDRPAGGVPSAGDRPAGAVPSAGDRPAGAVPSAGDRPAGAVPSAGDRTAGVVVPAGDRPAGAVVPAGNRPGMSTLTGKLTAAVIGGIAFAVVASVVIIPVIVFSNNSHSSRSISIRSSGNDTILRRLAKLGAPISEFDFTQGD
jgi:hypothetical protein